MSDLFGRVGMMFAGIRIVEDSNCGVMRSKQVRFPRSKKSRMRRKWAKKPSNWQNWLEPRAYDIGGTIVAHPLLVAEIRRRFQ